MCFRNILIPALLKKVKNAQESDTPKESFGQEAMSKKTISLINKKNPAILTGSGIII
jgi:hypothetical protein